MNLAMAFLMGCLLSGPIQVEDGVAGTVWHHPPFRVQAGDVPLDTADAGGNGHAAPYLTDLDGDGKRDLVVGSISGRFHFYRNVGTDAAPAFGRQAINLAVAQRPARIPNWCCMAAAPQFIDLDGDGVLDLTTASYGGPSYVFKGLGGLKFGEKYQLLTSDGMTVLAHPETFDGPQERDVVGSYAANIAWTRWNGDDHPDLLLGNNAGELFVWTGRPNGAHEESYGTPGIDEFQRVSLQKTHLDRPRNEILIDGGKVLPDTDQHSAPEAADWDGDGLFDIIVGSFSGKVYLLRNSGKAGTPKFASREVILAEGTGTQWLQAGEAPQRGTRSQVHAVDWNLDGKLDLLVGYHSQSWIPRQDLTAQERERLQAVREELAAIDARIGNDNHELIGKFAGLYLPENEATKKRVNELLKEAGKHLVQKTTTRESGGRTYTTQYSPYHGLVWVYLRK